MKYRRKPTGDPTRPLHVDAVRFHATAAGHQKTLNDIHNPFHLGTGSVTVFDPKNTLLRC